MPHLTDYFPLPSFRLRNLQRERERKNVFLKREGVTANANTRAFHSRVRLLRLSRARPSPCVSPNMDDQTSASPKSMLASMLIPVMLCLVFVAFVVAMHVLPYLMDQRNIGLNPLNIATVSPLYSPSMLSFANQKRSIRHGSTLGGLLSKIQWLGFVGGRAGRTKA